MSLKESLGRYAVISPSMPECLDAIRRGVRDSVSGLNAGKMKLLKLENPVELEIYFTNSDYAHIASHLPRSKMIGGWSIGYTAATMEEAYRVTQLLVFAASGVKSSVGE